ncbi:LysM domain-containing protein [Rathayibacter sp. YIM 133350]|uniref:LysM peptidoglycan-binding domain-containing protein n=1 Tax=Rathayibacter sp. YIM 133350 TaxID=3131992 RepID=UPI00307EC6DA
MTLAPAAIVGAIAVSLGGSHATATPPVHPDAGWHPTQERSLTPADASPSALRSAEVAPAVYTVVEGDTVSGIAARYGLATDAVLALNGLERSSLIFPGQQLALGAPAPVAPVADTAAPPATPAPSAGTHIVVAGDTLWAIAHSAGTSVQALLDANGLEPGALIHPGQGIVLAPAITLAAAEAPLAPAAPAPAPTAPAPVAPVAPTNGPDIAAAGGIVALTEEMRQNAAIIVSVGRSIGVDDRGLVIALAAAAQESGLRNLDVGDRDSLGVFQQRPSTGWGTPDEVRDPVRAAYAFFGGSTNPNAGRTRGLLDIAGWHEMTLAQAAQAVQISAFPDAYAKWELSASTWLAQLG